MEVIGQLHAPAALPLVPVGWEAAWGPRAGLEAVSKRKILSPRLDSNPDHPIVQPVASR